MYACRNTFPLLYFLSRMEDSTSKRGNHAKKPKKKILPVNGKLRINKNPLSTERKYL